jgi:2-methylcitrate dehydratase PrpD
MESSQVTVSGKLPAGMALTEQVARYASEISYDDIPEAVVERTKDALLDSLGGQLACSTLEHCRRAQAFARQHQGREEASVFGTDLKTSVDHAAFVNGIQGHGDEMDDTLHVFGHAGAFLVPAVLGTAQRENAHGQAVVAALVAGYDLAGRLGRAGFNLDVLTPRNFIKESTGGSLAAAAASGRVLGLGVEEMQAALGVAAEQSSGIQAKKYEAAHMNKSLHMGIASRNGVISAYMANVGYGGVFDVLDSPNGVFEAFVGEKARKEELTRDLGHRFEIVDTGFKRYAAGRPMHSAIEALLVIMRREELSVDDLDEVEVVITTLEHTLLSKNPTRNVNLEYVVAVAALDGRVAWEQFTPERREDPKLKAFLDRIVSRGSEELDAIKRDTFGSRPAEVMVKLHDGRSFCERLVFPPGAPQNPLGREELTEKFFYWSGLAMKEGQAKALWQQVMDIENLEDAAELGELLLVKA